MQSRKVNSKISIIIHPITRELLYHWEPRMGIMNDDFTRKILEWVTPFDIATIEGIKSKHTGEVINANLVLCPLLMEQFTSLPHRRLLKKVIQSVKVAKQGGAKLVCLVAYTAMVGTKGVRVQEATGIPYTNGLSFTSATLPHAIIEAMKALRYTRPAKVFIYGGNSFIYLLVKGLSEVADQFCVYYHRRDKLEAYCNVLPKHIKSRVKILSTPSPAHIKDSDLIINATHKFPIGFSDKIVKSGAIVLDMSYPRTIHTMRPDILIIDGVAIVPPGNKPKFNLNFGLPEGLCFPCMAEPMVLAFEKKFESYSLGRDISYDKADAIFNLAMKHGFKVGPLTAYEQVIPEEKLESVGQFCNKKHSLVKSLTKNIRIF